MEKWKKFLDKLPEDISEKILKLVFEENVKKANKSKGENLFHLAYNAKIPM